MDFVVLSSSRGTTFQAVLEAISDGSLQARCLGLVTDRSDRGCRAKAEAAGLPVVVVEKRAGEPKETYDRRLHKAILSLVPPGSPLTSPRSQLVIACMGWMRILSLWFIGKWKNRILNIHPALLPKFGGRGMYGDRVHAEVLASKEKQSGMTIHLMDEGVDTGPVLLQKTCPVEKGDTVQTLKARVQALEKEWYPKVLQMMHTGELQVSEA